ncbi:MAG: hypothetical protein PHT51_05115 [Patescibacteria group bacterium]|nr:hypothetical protein [Patescibacteria group bacterium]MDD4610853.1 hypothetical protein [Patescibacteria group bacterium]
MSVNFLMDKKTDDKEKARRERDGEDVAWTNPNKEEISKEEKKLPDLREDLKKIEKKPKETGVFTKKLASLFARKKKEIKKEKIVFSPQEMSENKEKNHTQPTPSKVKKNKMFFNLFAGIKKLFVKKEAKSVIRKIEDVHKETTYMAKEKQEQYRKPLSIKYSKGEKDGMENPKILESNLVKGQALHFFNWEKNIVILIITLLIPALILTLAYWELKNVEDRENANLSELNSQIKTITANLNIISDYSQEAKNFQKKLNLVNGMLDKHVYWTNFFKLLEEKTLAQVWYLGGFSGDLSGNYTLNARTKSYSLIESQVKELLLSPYISQAQVGGGTVFAGTKDSSPGIDFVLNFTVKPSLFSDYLKK